MKRSIDAAKAFLLENIKPGDTIYLQYHKYQQIGENCYRYYTCYIARHGEVWNITGDIATVGDFRLCVSKRFTDTLATNEGSFEVVYHLAYKLFGDGNKLKEGKL